MDLTPDGYKTPHTVVNTAKCIITVEPSYCGHLLNKVILSNSTKRSCIGEMSLMRPVTGYADAIYMSRHQDLQVFKTV